MCLTRLAKDSSGHTQRGTLDRMPISARTPRLSQDASICIEVHPPWGSQNWSTSEKDLERFRRDDPGAELAGHRSRGTLARVEIDGRRIDEIPTLEHRGGKPNQKPERHLVFVLALPAKVLLECHPAGQKIEQCGAHSEWCRRRRGNAESRTFVEHCATRIECEEVEPIDVEVRAPEECLGVGGVDARREHFDDELWIDVTRHDRKYLDLTSIQAR